MRITKPDALKILLVLSVMLAISPSVFALNISNSRQVSELSAQVSDHGTISISSGSIGWVKINQTVPQSELPYQEVSSRSSQTGFDPLGNEIGYIYIENPPLKIDYNIKTDIVSRSRVVYSLPSFYTIPEDVRVYLEPTENIQSGSPEIVNLAKEITKDSSSDFEKVGKIAIWVNENLNYDLKYAGASKDALWVLQNKIGVCAEYTTIFTALARASGIPARYASAVAYGDNGWEPHAYTEVYIGKWIPVDALWLEAGYLDGTHIKYTVQLDNVVINDVKAYGTSIGDIKWTSVGTDVDVSSVKYSDPISYSSVYYPDVVEPGDDILVFASIKPEDFRLERFDLEPCTGSINPIAISDKSRKEILEAETEKNIIWTGKASQSLDANIIYTCPLVLNSMYFETAKPSLKIESSNPSKVEISALLSNPTANTGDTETVYAEIRMIKGTSPIQVYFVDSNNAKKIDLNLAPGEVSYLTYSFEVKGTGKKYFYIYSSSGDLSRLEYTSGNPGLVRIENISIPEFSKISSQSFIEITIVNNKASPQSVKLYVNNEIQSFVVDKSINKKIQIDTESAGTKKINVKLTDGISVLDELNRQVTVYDIPDITVNSDVVSIDGTGIVEIEAAKDSARNVTVTISGSKKDIAVLEGKKEIQFNLLPGSYSAKVYFEDASGKSYEKSFEITLREEGFLGKIIRLLKEQIGRIFS